jgi:death-on-curing protein
VVKRFVLEMENIAVYVASNVVSRDLLREIIASLLYEEDYSESLKLTLIEAISQNDVQEE